MASPDTRTLIPVASIIIPAHNEASVIGRCLDTLLAEARPDEFEVVVVPNGCTDDTAAIARSRGVRVLDTPKPGKANALNHGDRSASTFPRLFVDADIRLTTIAARATAAALRDGSYLAAAPRLRLDFADAGPLVRAYYAVWRRTRFVEDGLIGSGVYGLSQAGRERFDAFPDIIADDLFAYGLFSDSERRTVDAEFVVTTPQTLRGVIAVKTRVFAGNLQYAALHPSTHAPQGLQIWGVLRRLPRRKLLAVPIYLGVQAAAKVRARRQIARGDTRTWGRDDTSRQVIGR